METEAKFGGIYTTHLLPYTLRGDSPFISGVPDTKKKKKNQFIMLYINQECNFAPF
jgi:hypothetical protein